MFSKMLPAEIATESQKSKTECIIGFGDLYVASIQNTHRHTFIPYLFEYKSHFLYLKISPKREVRLI